MRAGAADSVALTKAKVHGLTIAVSVVVHGAVTGVLLLIAYRSLASQPAGPPRLTSTIGGGAVSVELPAVGNGIVVEEQPIDPIGDPPRITAGQDVARLDTGAAGRGGTATRPRARAQSG